MPSAGNTVEYLKTHTDKQFICLERSLDTTKKWNLSQYLGDKLHAFLIKNHKTKDTI
jgi:hypothetical protein